MMGKWLFLVQVGVVAGTLAAAAGARAESREVLDSVAWVGTLGLPSAQGLQPIEFWAGSYSQGGDQTPAKRPISFPAFLLEDGEDSITVLSVWLRPHRVAKKSVPALEFPVRYETRSMDWMIGPYLGHFGLMSGWQEIEEPMPSNLLKQALLARYCQENNRPDLVRRIVEVLGRFRDQEAGDPSKARTLEAVLEADASRYLLQLIYISFADSAKSWGDLHRELTTFIQKFPSTTEGGVARRLAAGVAGYLEEEKSNPLLSREATQHLPLAEQAVELVRKLRNVTRENSLGDQAVEEDLIKLGMAAVPTLIPALDDQRPVRSVRYVRVKSWQHDGDLQSVADLAAGVLMELSGEFFENYYTGGVAMPPVEAPGPLRREAEAWWTESRSKGEKQFLLDAVSAGGNFSTPHFQKLVSRYPAEAAPAVTAAYAKAIDPQQRAGLLRGFGAWNDPACFALLQQALSDGETVEIRAAAASSLRQLGQPGGTEAMLREWKKLRDGKHSQEIQWVIDYLCSDGRTEVIREMTVDLSRRPLRMRMAVCSGLSGAWHGFVRRGALTPPLRWES